MGKFIRKPVILEGYQFWGGAPINNPGLIYDSSSDKPRWFIETLEGRMEVSEGDWIMTGVEGEKYPVKQSIFPKIYEAVKEPLENPKESRGLND